MKLVNVKTTFWVRNAKGELMEIPSDSPLVSKIKDIGVRRKPLPIKKISIKKPIVGDEEENDI